MADKRISQLAERVDIANNDVVAIVASGATATNKATISSIQSYLQTALDVGVTSVGVTIGESGSDVNVVGSPITTSGNITINIPSAGVSERGVLTSEDYTSFLNKQNTITLTTSGTSGNATFDGSLLNIPNYTTDTSGFVTIDTDQTITGTKIFDSYIYAHSFIKIDGTSSQFLKADGSIDSTEYVTIDTDQTITGIKTFGNNALQVASGGSGSFPTVIRNITVNSLISGGFNHLGFNNLNNIYFSKGSGSFNAGVFAFNNTGTRTYTLPDASGTVALTSDFTGFVTLDTNQTITGVKTFDSIVFANSFVAQSFVKIGGTSSQFLKANGSIDSTEYVTIDTAQTITGQKTFNSRINLGTSSSLRFAQTNVFITPSPDENVIGVLQETFTFAVGRPNINGLSQHKIFGLVPNLLTNNIKRNYQLPNASGVLALTSDLNSYLPLTGGTLTGALNGTSAVFTGGVNLATVSGNVGIGTTTPSSLLHLSLSSASAASIGLRITQPNQTVQFGFFELDTVSTRLKIGVNGASLPLTFDTNTTERLRITNEGNVGIGTTNPSAKLEVNGTVGFNTTHIPTTDPNISGRIYRNALGQLFISL